MDEGLGRIREALDAAGVADNTVIVYTSDNGFACGHHGVWGKGNGTWPLNMWDASVRVPFVIHVPDGRTGVSEALVSAASLHPTLCELAGVTPPSDPSAAGPSIAPLLRGEEQATVDTVVVLSEYGGARMITDGRWKLILRHDGPDELFDLGTDPQERRNLIDDEAAAKRRDELATALADWFAEHEREETSGYERDVRGFGQIHPLWREEPDSATFLRGNGRDESA